MNRWATEEALLVIKSAAQPALDAGHGGIGR